MIHNLLVLYKLYLTAKWLGLQLTANSRAAIILSLEEGFAHLLTPLRQIWMNSCIFIVPSLRQQWSEESKGRIILCDRLAHMKFKLQHLSEDLPEHGRVMEHHGYCAPTAAELSSCDGHCMVHRSKNIYRKIVLTLNQNIKWLLGTSQMMFKEDFKI